MWARLKCSAYKLQMRMACMLQMIFILTHNTAGRIDEDYFIKLEKDEQVSNYLWATMQEVDAPAR